MFAVLGFLDKDSQDYNLKIIEPHLDGLNLNLESASGSCVTLGKLLILSKLPFSHLYNGVTMLLVL